MNVKQFNAKNQFVLSGDGFSAFQSYNSIIVLHTRRKTYLGKDWDYSVTTGKYRNKYLGETKKETQKKINSGEYILADLDDNDVFKKAVSGEI